MCPLNDISKEADVLIAAPVSPLLTGAEIPSLAPAAKYNQEPILKLVGSLVPTPVKSYLTPDVRSQLPVSNAKPSSYIATPATEPEPFDPAGPTWISSPLYFVS